MGLFQRRRRWHEEASLKGATAGVIGAMAMTGARLLMKQLGLVGRVPPEELVDEKLPVLRNLQGEGRNVAVELLHWSYGGVGGAVFGLLPKTLQRRAWFGPAYGVGIWVFYEAAVAPLLGLARASSKRVTERAMFALDHALYGLVVQGERWSLPSHLR